MKLSPHTHCESPLTGSTIDTMVERAKTLGRTHFVYTDHGHLSSCFKTYAKAKEKGLKFIPGLEFYFKDSSCPYVTGTQADRCKYFTATIYCEDQDAYQTLCMMVSRTDFPTIEIYEERQQLWSWKELEYISKYNVTLVLGGIHCMVGKTLLAGRADLGDKVFQKLQYLFKERFFVSLVCEIWTKKWSSVVEIKLVDGSTVSCLANDTVTTDRARRIKASDLVERSGHKILKNYSSGGISIEVNNGIAEAKVYKGFLPLPGGDAMLMVNKFLKALANKYQTPIIPSDYAYYAEKDDKIVQTMRLEGKNKLQPNFYMKSEEEAKTYYKNVMGMDDGLIYRIFNNLELFISRFSKLEFKYEWHLADSGTNSFQQAMAIIKENGRMHWDDPKYVERLTEELTVIAKNPIKDLIPYFLPIRDVLNHYKANGLLTGPGRGSAGGSLFCYLLGITQVNPFKYDLPFSRFFSMDRIMTKELPDIDVDLESRELLIGEDGKSGYLYSRYGDKAAQISTRTTIRLKSAIKDTNRYFKGKVEPEIEIFSKGLPPPPQGVNDHQFVFGYEDSEGEHIAGLIEQSEDLRKYAENRPQEWSIVSKAMGLTRAFSKHACFAKGTLVDNNGVVRKICDSNYSVDKPIKTWSSGIRDTVLVCLNNGIVIQCTPDHKFICNGIPVEAQALEGNTVDYKPFKCASGIESLPQDLAFSLGWALNNGSFNRKRSNQTFHFTPQKDDEGKSIILRYLSKNSIKVWYGRKDELHCGKRGLSDLFFESKRNAIQRLPDYFWQLNFESQCVFMRGFFSANGYVLNSRKRLATKLSSKLLGNDISIWLNSIDIKTAAIFGNPKHFNIDGRDIVNTGYTEIHIVTHESKVKFEKYIGFVQTYKAKRLQEIIENKHTKDDHSQRERVIRCLKVIPYKQEEVFDFNEPQENIGYINGVLVHNSAFVLSDVPIKSIVPVRDGNITQYEAKECEAAGLIKYDYLVLNQLKDIRICIDLINKRNGEKNIVGYFTHGGKHTYIWELPEVSDVFKSIWGGSCETIFQINTKSMIPFVMKILPSSIMDLATILALVRPGPMDFIDKKTGRNMVEEYVLRRRKESEPDIKELAELLPETYGILCIKRGSKVKTIEGMIPIENVKVGSLVQTEDGTYQRVLRNLYKGRAETIEVRLDNSETLTVTPEHKVLTNRGWVEAQHLTDRDLVKHYWVSDKQIEDGDDKDWLIGLILADGNLCSTSISIAAGSEENARKIKTIADKAFGIDCGIYKHMRCWYVGLSSISKSTNLNSNPVISLVRDLGLWGLNSYTKKFPTKITKAMIEGFIEGDGNISNGRIRIKNRYMAEQIFETLQALRIKSSIFLDKDVDTVTFDCSSLNFRIKTKRISKGLYFPKPNLKLPRSYNERQNFPPSMKSKVPFISWKALSKLEQKYGIKVDKTQTWSKVISIKKSEICDVYDLSIDKIHSFVVGGNVVHNCFQEQLNKIARDIAGFPGEKAEKLRKNMAKKKMKALMDMKPEFIEGAVKKVSPETAEAIWERMVTFGRYGFSIIHAVEYAMITYACMFLKYYYPFEWWAAVLTNAEEQEITEKFWPYVKDIVSPPDINLSGDTMVVDYANGKIRSKLGIIRGIGESTISPIVSRRPYKDIQDFVNKEVAGPTLAHKLIHIGVLDSLFPPRTSLLEKLKLYEDAVEVKKFHEKLQIAQKTGKKIRSIRPKEGVIPEEYLNISPIKDAAMRKSILPSLPIDLFNLGKKYSKVRHSDNKRDLVVNNRGYDTLLINGEKLKRLDEVDGSSMPKDVYVAATCFVVKAEEFSYPKKNPTRRALKIILDADGYISEKFKWPDYETGVLTYPQGLKKGSIATIFFRKKVGKNDMNITDIILETE